MKFLRLVLLAARQRLDRVNAIDRAANISPEAWVSGCTIGPDVSVGNGCKLYRATLVGKVSISRYTSLWGPEIYAGAGEHGISVGSFCSIAHHVSLQEVFHNPQRTTTYFFERNMLQAPEAADAQISKGPIRIGNDVWIGAGAQVLSGVSIGDGAIVGAGAIVTRDVPPYAIVAGNPARHIRYRFAPDVIDELLRLQWWDWSEERLRSEATYLTRIHSKPV